MDKTKYLNRINFFEEPKPTVESLISLHQKHLYNIPYENLDIKLGKKIILEEKKIYKKVMLEERGGFCYELNYLFFKLLSSLGYSAKIISARIYKEEEPGPECDHMAIIVQIGTEKWLCDVGFGDLFIRPLKIDFDGPQEDESYIFKIEKLDEESYLLYLSEDGLAFEKKYIFNLNEKKLEDFIPQCEFKQTSPTSYFVENNICSVPIEKGRKTIFNLKFIKKKNGEKNEILISSQNQENRILEEEFNIRIDF